MPDSRSDHNAVGLLLNTARNWQTRLITLLGDTQQVACVDQIQIDGCALTDGVYYSYTEDGISRGISEYAAISVYAHAR